VQDDLWLTRKGDTAHLFASTSSYYEAAGPVSWDFSMSVTPDSWRVAVRKGDVLSTTTTYETERGSWYESMGIMIAWMADAATPGADPFTTPVDTAGPITHGHLPENDNHGGQPDPANFNDVTTLASNEMPAGSVLPIADFAYQGDMSVASSIPTVVEGGSLAFRNDDDANDIWHTITSCEAPCNLSTGIAYPLANGPVGFDSGELGSTTDPPSKGAATWSTPEDLPPGTYTYFCRIHPFMRGAFRVVPDS
jgi:hypothetical protein